MPAQPGGLLYFMKEDGLDRWWEGERRWYAGISVWCGNPPESTTLFLKTCQPKLDEMYATGEGV